MIGLTNGFGAEPHDPPLNFKPLKLPRHFRRYNGGLSSLQMFSGSKLRLHGE
jgi:hypothetical protein